MSDDLAYYAANERNNDREASELLDSDDDLRNKEQDEDNEKFLKKLNDDSDEELLQDSDEDNIDHKAALDISDSEDDMDVLDENGVRDEAAVQLKLRARKKQAMKDRLTFEKFFMPKRSDLRKAAGLIPKEKEKVVKKKKVFGKEDNNEIQKPGFWSEMKDSAKTVLAYYTGEEMYETKPLGFEDIPDIIGKTICTNFRRIMINWVGHYNLNLRGFKKYYKPASKTLLLACRSRYIKPFQVADLLEEGADPNVAEIGTETSPLHYLCRRGNLKGVKLLCEAGGNPLQYDAQHRNALMCACDTNRSGDQIRIVRYLLSTKYFSDGKNLEHRDTGGNTAAINAIFKGNVWILRQLLINGARVTETYPEMGYESAHDVALWVYAAGLLQDIKQLTPRARQDPDHMGCAWHYLSFKGRYYYAPILLFQHQWKYSNDLCLRMCQFAKKSEDLIEWPERPRKAVLRMTDNKRENREIRRSKKENEIARKDRYAKKLVSRKLAHEVKEVEEWNRQRLMFAKRIDNEFKKGKYH